MPKRSDIDALLDSADVIGAPVETRTVPNLFPVVTKVPYKIAIIGEAPGKDEVDQGIPFVGYSGRDLDSYLSRHSILRDACFIGNVCQHRPFNNVIANFDWNGAEIQSGLAKLKSDLTSIKPNICLLLGGSALHAFMAPNVVPARRKTKDGLRFVFPNNITDWRGSFFTSHPNSPCANTKCIASLHPAACMRQYEWTPLLLMDIKRCATEAEQRELELPVRQLRVNLTFEETMRELDFLLYGLSGPVGTDIEGYWNCVRCISFAPTPHYAFIVPFVNMNGTPCWPLEEEAALLGKVAEVLANGRLIKVWQNGLYDRFSNQYKYQMVTRGSQDIMLQHWELHCELPKALDVQTSIYTKEPYYKAEYAANDAETFHKYCCKDSAVTIEIHEKLNRYLSPMGKTHYDFNVVLLNALLYMELRGIKYNATLAKGRKSEIDEAICERQYHLDKIAGRGLSTTDKVVLRALIRDTMCWKTDLSKVKKEFQAHYDLNMRTLMGDGPLTDIQLGRLNRALKHHLNTDSTQQLQAYLYTELGLPVQHNPQTKAITCDYPALITLRRKSDHPSLPIIIELTELLTRAGMLEMLTDDDGRIRTNLNLVGSETGRVTSLKSPTGSGHNLQTIPDENELKPENHPLRRGMRDLVTADDGHYLAKCDLRGADGWTIGAHLASIGHPTMLDDLKFGLKPAHFPCFARRHGRQSIKGKTRPELKEMFGEIKKSDWDYFSAKQCTWGFCYQMGVDKAISHIFNVSEGTVLMNREDATEFKLAIFERYNVEAQHRAMERMLFQQPYPPRLVSPSGHVREFWGRRQEIIGQALAHLPQSVTTYATNMAVYRCWTDPENRVGNNLRVEPLHQVHDEALFQFHISDTEWATGKIRQWFNNPINIFGISVIIPFEGSYGTDWSMNEKSKKGDI